MKNRSIAEIQKDIKKYQDDLRGICQYVYKKGFDKNRCYEYKTEINRINARLKNLYLELNRAKFRRLGE